MAFREFDGETYAVDVAQEVRRQAVGRQVRSGTTNALAWQQAADALADVHGRFGSEPPIGTVLRWKRDMGGSLLDYVALRASNGRWYVTGQEAGPIAWASIVGWVGVSPCSVAVGWREIPAPEPDPSGDEAVQGWAAQFIAPSAAQDVTES